MRRPARETVARRRRLALAAYLDFLVLSVPAALVVWGLSETMPALGSLGLPARLVLFLVAEVVLVRQVRWSPGSWLLAVRVLRPSELEEGSQESLGGRIFLVDEGALAAERWWTLLLGVICVLDGAKSLARWTQFVAPAAVFGVPLGDAGSIAFHVVTGAALWVLAVGVFRLVPALVAAGAAFHAVAAVSWLLSWSSLPVIAAEYVLRRRAFQGLSVREGEIELAQAMMPAAAVAVSAISAVWFVLVLARAFGARREARASGNPGGVEGA